MYRIETVLTTITTLADLNEALTIAEKIFTANKYNYIEVKEVITENPFYAKSVKIFWR